MRVEKNRHRSITDGMETIPAITIPSHRVPHISQYNVSGATQNGDQSSQLKDLTFVNITGSSHTRRMVRSIATSYSHRDLARKAKRSRGESEREPPSNSLQIRRGSSASEQSVSPVIPATHLGEPVVLFQQADRDYLAAVTSVRRSKSEEPNLLRLDVGDEDPFDAFPVPTEPWFRWVLDYYRRIFLPSGIATLQQSQKEGSSFISWNLQEAITEPAYFYMQLVNACPALLVQGRIDHAQVIWLRGRTVAALNEAIGDPVRSLSTAILLTVASIAVHERLYGDKAAAVQIHGQAFARMLAMKGGTRSLQIPRILLRILQSADLIVSGEEYSHTFVKDLLYVWAPDEIRSRHPGYSLPADS